MKSPNGSRWRITVDNNGSLIRTIITLVFLMSFMCGSQAQVRDLVYGTNNVVIGPTNTNALSFTNSISFSNPLTFGTNAATTRTNLGVTVASNLPAPYSGAATTNSLLVADGSGSSAFVSTIPKLTIASGTITNTNPALTISQTWSNSNSVFTGVLVNIANSNSATGSVIADFQTNGTSAVSVNRTGIGIAGTSWMTFSPTFGSAVAQSGVWYFNNSVAFGVASSLGTGSGAVQLASTESLGWSSATQPYSANADLRLFRDTNDTLAQRRTTNPQTYNIYNTFSNSTNYERGKIAWTNNVLTIGTEKGTGGGTARALQFQTDGVTGLTMTTNGMLSMAYTDGSSSYMDFGDARFRVGVRGGIGSLATDGTSRAIQIHCNGIGANASTTGFYIYSIGTISYGGLFQFGGTTTNFPALKRTNTVLQVRLADDSAYTTIDAQHRLQGTAPTNSTDTGTAGDIRYDTNNYIYICVSSNTWRRTSLTNW